MPQHENGEKGRLESREKPNHCRWPILVQRPRSALYLWGVTTGPHPLSLSPFPSWETGEGGRCCTHTCPMWYFILAVCPALFLQCLSVQLTLVGSGTGPAAPASPAESAAPARRDPLYTALLQLN